MSLDLAHLAELTPFHDLTIDLPDFAGLAGIQSVMDRMVASQAEMVKGLDLAGIQGPVLPVDMMGKMLENASGMGDLIEQLGARTSVMELAAVNALGAIAPIIEGIQVQQAAALAPMLEAIKLATNPAIVPPSIAGILSSIAAIVPPGFAIDAMKLPTIAKPDWSGLRGLDFETPVGVAPVHGEENTPASSEVARYATVDAVERLTERIADEVVGVQVMLSAAARMREKWRAEDNRDRHLMTRLFVLGIVVPSIWSLLQIVLD